MNSNITYPGVEGFIIKKSGEQNGVFYLHVEMERGDYQCLRYNTLTNKVHDYRIQKIQHIKIFARDTFIYYKKRRYVCRNNECSKRFYESNAFI